MEQKYNLGTKLTYIWHKNEKKISPNFIFVFQPLCFRHICHALSKFASQIKLIQYVVGVSCYSQGPRVPLPGSWMSRSHVPGSQFRSLRVPSLRIPGSRVSGSRVSGSQGSGSQVSGFWIMGAGPQVLILDYALSSFKVILIERVHRIFFCFSHSVLCKVS